MLDKKRIRLMAKMSAYEKKHEKEDLRISSYYKKDYESGLQSGMRSWQDSMHFVI